MIQYKKAKETINIRNKKMMSLAPFSETTSFYLLDYYLIGFTEKANSISFSSKRYFFSRAGPHEFEPTPEFL